MSSSWLCNNVANGYCCYGYCLRTWLSLSYGRHFIISFIEKCSDHHITLSCPLSGCQSIDWSQLALWPSYKWNDLFTFKFRPALMVVLAGNMCSIISSSLLALRLSCHPSIFWSWKTQIGPTFTFKSALCSHKITRILKDTSTCELQKWLWLLIGINNEVCWMRNCKNVKMFLLNDVSV